MISWQFSFAHGTNHDVTKRSKMFLAYRNIRVCRLQIQIDLEDFRNCFLHLDEPLLANAVYGIFIAIDDVTNAEIAIEIVVIILGVVMMNRTRAARCRWLRVRRRTLLVAIRWTICAAINMTETCITQAAVFRKLFLVYL